jgi:multimeric flavodoxin WrbA
MKVLSINGSPRKKGNTHIMLDRVCDYLADAGAEVHEAYLHGMDLAPCRACMQCMEVNDGHCHGVNDDCDELIELSRGADVILLGSPVYFGSVTGQIKAYMDRVGFVSRVGDGFLRRKIGAAVAPARRAGELFTFAQLNMWFLINGMVVPGSTYWNVGHALKEGEIMDDTEALSTLDELARNIQWLAGVMSK